jgi:4a-hydroxytetrahydrobiopterin dehydratase
MSLLHQKACVPCQGNMPPLTQGVASNLLLELNANWRINEANHLYKPYKFNDFMEAMAFANKIADVAEKEGHHPNLLVKWGGCDVEIWTHKIDGLTENDFILAAKIETLA